MYIGVWPYVQSDFHLKICAERRLRDNIALMYIDDDGRWWSMTVMMMMKRQLNNMHVAMLYEFNECATVHGIRFGLHCFALLNMAWLDLAWCDAARSSARHTEKKVFAHICVLCHPMCAIHF